MNRDSRDVPGTTLGSSRLVAGVLLVASIAPACVAIYVGLGSPVAIPPAIAFLATVVAWVPRLRREPVRLTIERRPVFLPYIAAMVALMVQYTEQWLAHLPALVMRDFPDSYPPGVSYSDRAMIAVYPLATSAMFLLGALALYRRHPAGEGAAWLLFIWSVVNAVTPFAYAALGHDGAHYVGGMLMAPVVAAFGIEGLRRLIASPALRVHSASQARR